LLKWSPGRSTPARLVQRAKIVLAAAAGKRNGEIAAPLVFHYRGSHGGYRRRAKHIARGQRCITPQAWTRFRVVDDTGLRQAAGSGR